MSNGQKTSKQLIEEGAPSGADMEDPVQALFAAHLPDAILAMPFFLSPPDRVGSQQKPVRVLDALMQFFLLPPDRLEGLQRRLLASKMYPGGYYDERKGWRPVIEPRWGIPDEDTFAAFSGAILRSARKQWAKLLTPTAVPAETPTVGTPKFVPKVVKGRPEFIGERPLPPGIQGPPSPVYKGEEPERGTYEEEARLRYITKELS